MIFEESLFRNVVTATVASLEVLKKVTIFSKKSQKLPNGWKFRSGISLVPLPDSTFVINRQILALVEVPAQQKTLFIN